MGVVLKKGLEMDCQLRVGVVMECEEDSSLHESSQALIKADQMVRWPKWVDESLVNVIKRLKCYENVREMVISGIPLEEVARQIHIFGELNHVMQSSVRQYLEHYKATIPKGLLVAKHFPGQFQKTMKRVDDGIDVVNELGSLYKKMNKRIDIAMKREEAVGFLLQNVEKQFSVAADLLMKLFDKKEMLGLNERTIREAEKIQPYVTQVDWDGTYSKPGMNEVMSNPASRAKVVKFIENMSSLYGKLPPEKQKEIVDAVKRKKAEEDGKSQEDLSVSGVS